ncbi:hypothetical protein GOC91_00560 [Sinorhizobium medicae]|uniref:Uncharacterized protein n=1 Tax=Sinorhizobium medicae TaxID=110321 RepID=A0A508X4Z6_9HYPH|nr:hypothetical protein [Sinorhizobium medicae]MDX0403748.1 hypothetical protein [Sinorhizobium medicae]MDX0409249.1 hypothetical protein [Sinorhizobium medicae]MDX0415363.1 hypothetical protein [Sinorhizobium medicae]MDX0421345.1 hypothetical protein [Sinorhizobium medicae]MDX0427390.1 hypothetical protein [Sinorhizobium medicae]
MAKHKQNVDSELIKTWSLPTSVTLGSAVRAKGILQEIRARLPLAVRKALVLESAVLTMSMPDTSRAIFRATSASVTGMLSDMESLPVIPREIEDILAISTSERRRWLQDGRLPSAGTRTVKLRGRARQITFHVFDPAVVMDILDRGAVDEWREDDIVAVAEKRRQSAMKAKLTRSLRKKKDKPAPKDGSTSSPLRGWDEFDADGFLK